MDGTRDLHDHALDEAADASLGEPAVSMKASVDYDLGWKNASFLCADDVDKLVVDHVGGYANKELAARLRDLAADWRMRWPR